MQLSPDSMIIYQISFIQLNGTILFTWLVMALLSLGSWLVTRHLSTGPQISRWQNMLESIVTLLLGQIQDVTRQEPRRFLPFIGTLFLFIASCNLLAVFPGFHPPTGSLSTTAGLAISVFLAVPLYGVSDRGFVGYITNYLKPTPMMLPFNIMGEISRTLALAVRLFGNVMSGTMIGGILLALTSIGRKSFFQLLFLGLIKRESGCTADLHHRRRKR